MNAPTLAAALAFSVLACTQRPTPQAPPPGQPSSAAAVDGDSASRITVAAGDTFQVTLAANMTTGYHWELADSLDASRVVLVRHVYVPHPNPRHAAGSGGTDHWTFRAVSRGTTRISLAYFPPGRSSFPPPEVRRITVMIR
jgi:predicted secreted protein